MLLILDVSEWQTAVDWRRVRAAGIGNVFVRATHGDARVDKRVKLHAAGARAAGLRVGFYHYAFAQTAADAATESANFVRVVRPLTTRADLRPVLDFETWPAHLTAAQMAEWARDWNHRVRDALSAGPLFYSYPAFMQRLGLVTPIGYGLWLAAYDRNDGSEHPYTVPPPWRKAVAHQFTSRAKVPGVTGLADLSAARSLRPLLAHPLTSVQVGGWKLK